MTKTQERLLLAFIKRREYYELAALGCVFGLDFHGQQAHNAMLLAAFKLASSIAGKRAVTR